MDIIKISIIVLLGCIVASLGKAMFHLSSGPEDSARTVQALTFRIGLSIALFLLLLAAWYFGGITPHGS